MLLNQYLYFDLQDLQLLNLNLPYYFLDQNQINQLIQLLFESHLNK